MNLTVSQMKIAKASRLRDQGQVDVHRKSAPA